MTPTPSAPDAAPIPVAARAALTFIFITLLIDVTGLGLIIPVIPTLIQELLAGHGTGADLSHLALNRETLAAAARYGGWLGFTYAAIQFGCAPILGGLSDAYGRRPVLLFSLVGFGLDYVLQGFAPTIGWLFIGRAVAGFTGASFTTASAYIADVSTPENRAQNFGLIGAAFGAGFILGPAAGGLLGQYGPRVPFFAAAVLAFSNAIYGYFVLPESLPAHNRRPFDWRRANPVATLLRLRTYPVILSLTVCFFLLYLAGSATQTVWTYFTQERFAWTPREVGFSLGFVGLVIGLVQGGLTRIAIPRLGPQRAVLVGLGFYFVGFTLFAFASRGWMMYAFMVPYGLGGIAGPALQSIITGQVPPTEQGELQGGLTSLISVSAIIGPLLMTNLFAHFTQPGAPLHFPGAPFLLGAVLTAGAAALAARSFARHPTAPKA